VRRQAAAVCAAERDPVPAVRHLRPAANVIRAETFRENAVHPDCKDISTSHLCTHMYQNI
jgi:hypothetical protein